MAIFCASCIQVGASTTALAPRLYCYDSSSLVIIVLCSHWFIGLMVITCVTKAVCESLTQAVVLLLTDLDDWKSHCIWCKLNQMEKKNGILSCFFFMQSSFKKSTEKSLHFLTKYVEGTCDLATCLSKLINKKKIVSFVFPMFDKSCLYVLLSMWQGIATFLTTDLLLKPHLPWCFLFIVSNKLHSIPTYIT